MAQKKQKRVTPLGTTVILSENRKPVQCVGITPVIAPKKNYHCMWCTLQLTGSPIGCPTGTKTVLKEQLVYLRDNTEPVRTVQREPSTDFITYGIFCSVNCIKSFINDKKYDAQYRHSLMLLSKMYSIMTGTDGPVNITPSPHYSMLSKFGGNMSETQYKQAMHSASYTENCKFNMFPTTVVYNENTTM